jgi:acyl carrier protein
MDVLTPERTEVRIAAIVARMLAKRGAATDAGREQNLRDAGLTSLDMVNLMLAVEGEFDIFIPQDAMTPENFRTISAIDALVSTLIPAA